MSIVSTPAPARVRRVFSFLAAFLCLPIVASARTEPRYAYVSPVPGSRLHSPGTNIILRPEGRAGAPHDLAVHVTGMVSGAHPGQLFLSDDGRTLIFEPATDFAPGEEVRVRVGRDRGARARGGLRTDRPREFEFNFFVSPFAPRETAALAQRQSRADLPDANSTAAGPADEWPDEPPPPPDPSNTGPLLPPGCPTTRVLDGDPSGAGLLFLAPFAPQVGNATGHLEILDEAGVPVFYRQLPQFALDFKVQRNGRLTYYTDSTPANPTPQYFALDSSYAVVDSFAAGNGYFADEHDLQLLPNGHALLMIYDAQPVRMDSIVPGGRPDAIVTGVVVQELDRSGRVVFQWRSWDHFAITDLVTPNISLRGRAIDYVHANSVEPDRDGNLLLSCRHMSEITKIDRRTGAVMWRLGPRARNNQFTFVGDARGFSHQHDARWLPNGNLTLYDNGNFVFPQQSRAVEYAIDERRKVATLVWEYQHTPQRYGAFMGNVQRLPDGSTVIGWGGVPGGASCTEVDPSGKAAYELGFNEPVTHYSYRAFRFPWRTTRIRVEPQALDFGASAGGAPSERTVVVTNPGREPIAINAFEVRGAAEFTVPDPRPITLAPGGSATVRIAYAPASPGRATGVLTLAAVNNTERIAQQVALVAGEDAPLAAATTLASAGRPVGLSLRATNPARREATIRFTLPRTADVSLEVFGVRGRRVATVVQGTVPAGEHVTAWAAEGLPSGVYFCRLVADGETVTQKFALIQ